VVEEVMNKTEAEVAKLGRTRYLRLLQHTAKFAERQFGNRIDGKSSYKRDDGDRMENWVVEINILSRIYHNLVHYILISDATMKNTIPYLEKALAVLDPWRAEIDSSERERIDIIDEEKIETLLDLLQMTEYQSSAAYLQLCDWDKAEYYCKQSIFHVKQMKEGEIRMKKVLDALSLLGNMYQLGDKLTEAKAIMEEAYMFVNEVYDPEHPLVLDAAGELIRALGMTGDHHDAERFARICYDSLTRPHLDPESYEAAKAAGNLAGASYNLIKANGPDSADIEEAEMLATTAVRIIKALKGPSDSYLKLIFGYLMNIKYSRKDYGDDTKSLLEDNLSDAIIIEGVDGKRTATANEYLGHPYHTIALSLLSNKTKMENFKVSYSHFNEVLRINTKIYGLDHPKSLEAASNLSVVSIVLE
jgi:hypothetical protein